MGIMERLAQSDYVVYGKTLNHKANKVKDDNEYYSYYVIDAIFEVFCIIIQCYCCIAEIFKRSVLTSWNYAENVRSCPGIKNLLLLPGKIMRYANLGVSHWSQYKPLPNLWYFQFRYRNPYLGQFSRWLHSLQVDNKHNSYQYDGMWPLHGIHYWASECSKLLARQFHAVLYRIVIQGQKRPVTAAPKRRK